MKKFNFISYIEKQISFMTFISIPDFREKKKGGGAERESQAGSMLSMELNMGLDLITLRS